MIKPCHLCGEEIEIETETHQKCILVHELQVVKTEEIVYLCMFCSVKFKEWMDSRGASN